MCKRLIVLVVVLVVAGTLPGYALTEGKALPVPADTTLQYGHALATATSPDYSNTTTGLGLYWNAGATWTAADDVHRTTDLPIARVEFGYYSAIPSGTTDASLTIFQNNSDDSMLPTPGTLLALIPLPGLPVGGAYVTWVDLLEPLVAPADLWIGLAFDVADTGFLVYYPPTVGTSHNLIWDERGGPGNWVPSFYLETYPVPEPTGLLALGSGIMGLVALRRRR